MTENGVRSHPSHDHKTFAILVREDLDVDLAHIDPRLVPLLQKMWSLAQILEDDQDPTKPWAPMMDAMRHLLRLSRSKQGFRSNQLTSSLRGAEDHQDPNTHVARQYETNGKSAWK